MKKFIILFSIMLMSLVGFSSEIVSKDSIQNIQSKELSERVYSDIKSAVTTLAEGMRIGAEKVYEAVRTQQFVESITNTFIYIMFCIAISIGIYCMKAGYKKRKVNDYGYCQEDHPQFIVGCILTAVAVIFFLIIFSTTILETITGFINPDFGAMNYILHLIH